MPTPHLPHPAPPEPTQMFFDPFHSSSTGHQRAEKNRLAGSTSWRASRTYKLGHQLRDASGRGGDQHRADLVGAGSDGFGVDGRKEDGSWDAGAPGLREKGGRDIRTLMGAARKPGSLEKNHAAPATTGMREGGGEHSEEWRQPTTTGNDARYLSNHDHVPSKLSLKKSVQARPAPAAVFSATSSSTVPPPSATDTDLPSPLPETPQVRPIFAGLTIFLNGSTYPLLSDHRLKQLLARHGATVSIALGRRTVTHVILGQNGGLAAGKMQKEITRVGGKGVKYVGPEWVLESIKAGKRQPEARFQVRSMAMKGQGSMMDVLTGKEAGAKRSG